VWVLLGNDQTFPNDPRGNLHAADGELAEDVATDAGERAREIHGHGPLLFHL